MAVNTALIQASFSERATAAKADVPDRKSLYTSTVDQTKQALGIVSGALDEYAAEKEQEKVDKKKRLEPLRKLAGNVYKSVYEMDEPLPDKVVTAIENEIMDVKEEYGEIIRLGGDDAQEGSRALARVMAKFKRITNEAVNLRTNFGLTSQDSHLWNIDEIHPDNIDPLMSIYDFGSIDENEGVSVSFDDNGKITFTTSKYTKIGMELDEYNNPYDVMGGDPISFNSDQMREMLPHQSEEFSNYSTENLNTFTKVGETDGVDNNYNYNQDKRNDVRNGYIGQIKTKEDFQSAKSGTVEIGIPDLKTSLKERIDIPMLALNSTFVDINGERLQGQELFDFLNANKDGDEVLDKSDLDQGLKGDNKKAFQKVYDQLLDALTNVHNPAFNLDVSAGLLADQQESYTKQKYDAAFKAKGGIIPSEMTAAEKIAKYSKKS